MAARTMYRIVPDESHVGWWRQVYLTVEVFEDGNGWHWRQLDPDGGFPGPASAAHCTKNEAYEDALASLGGEGWE
jgi:hypothetical protein